MLHVESAASGTYRSDPPQRRLVEPHAPARPDVEVDREPRVLRRGPERVPARVDDVGIAELVREDERDPLDPPLGGPPDLRDGLGRVPKRQRRERDEAPRVRLRVLLDLEVVVRPQARQPEVGGIAGVLEGVARDAGDVAEEGVHVHPVAVPSPSHAPPARTSSPACRPRREARTAPGPQRPTDDAQLPAIPAGPRPTVDMPGVLPIVVALHLGNQVPPLPLRHPRGPRLRPLLQMIVRRNHAVLHTRPLTPSQPSLPAPQTRVNDSAAGGLTPSTTGDLCPTRPRAQA